MTVWLHAQAAATLASALGAEFSLPPDLTGVLASLDSAVLAPAMQRLLTVVRPRAVPDMLRPLCLGSAVRGLARQRLPTAGHSTPCAPSPAQLSGGCRGGGGPMAAALGAAASRLLTLLPDERLPACGCACQGRLCCTPHQALWHACTCAPQQALAHKVPVCPQLEGPLRFHSQRWRVLGGAQMRNTMEKHGAAQILPPVEEALGLAQLASQRGSMRLESHRSEALASIMGPLEDALKGISRSGLRPSPLGRRAPSLRLKALKAAP